MNIKEKILSLVGKSIICLFLLSASKINAQTWAHEKFDITKGLMSSDIGGLFLDSRGFLWIGNGAGISRYDGKQFRNYTNDTLILPLNKDNKFAIRELADHSIGYSSDYGYVRVSNLKQPEIYTTRDCTLNKFIDDENGQHFITSGKTNINGHQYFMDGFINFDFTKRNPATNIFFKHPFEYEYQKTYLSNKGTIYRRYTNKEKTHFLYRIQGKEFILIARDISSNISGIFEDKQNNIWILPQEFSNENSIVKITGGIKSIISNPEKSSHNLVGSAYQTKSGDLIISAYQGLFVLKNQTLSFYGDNSYSLFSDDEDKLTKLLQIYVEFNGSIINGHRIFRDNTISQIPVLVDHLKSNTRVTDVLADHEGNLWYATSTGLLRIYLLPYTSDLLTISDERAEAMKDSVNQENYKFPVDTFPGDSYGLTDKKNKIQYVLPEHRKFFYVFDSKNKNPKKCYFKSRGSDYVHKRSYPLCAINDLIICQEFTRGVILYKLSKNKDSCEFKLINHANGLLTNYVEAVIADENENIWFITWEGIQVIKYKDLTDGNYANFTSFTSGIYHTIAPYLKDGHIYYANNNSIQSLNVNEFKRNATEANVVIESVKYIKNQNAINLQVDEQLVLPHDFRNLEIKFVGVCLSNGSKVRYRYKLEGLDNAWHENADRNITYSTLPIGEYTFKLYACNNDGVWNAKATEFKFSVLPPWWLSIGAIIGYVCAFLGIVFGFNGVRTEQLRKRQIVLEETVALRTKEVVAQKHLIEEKHKEITDSINYAERIQKSFLASEDILTNNLQEYFVFFQPKDVVSGDFYWAHKLSNGNFILVTADSTGHGVPGAIMSILNISSLEKAIEQKFVEPSDILNETRKTIITRLKKDGSKEGGKDGMDASLLCFNKEKTKLTYAAANNPIWIIREREMLELAPDKMPVGKHDKDNISFTQKEFDLKKGDVIYTLTDGMPDQFGGPKGKKFMYKQLKELLLAIHNEPLKIQKQKINQAFLSWKGNIEQVDDVCLIGISV